MKETTNYPIYLFEEPVLIPKELEETKELLFKIEDFLIRHETLRKEKTKIFNLCVEYFQTNLKLALNATFHLSILEKNIISLEFIFDEKESEFVKQLKKYNQVFRDKGFSEFIILYRNAIKNAVKNKGCSIEDNVIMMFYSHLRNNKYIFKEEITKEDKYKITYQIGKPN